MIAKLVVWSEDRISALEKLHRKLSDYQVVGLDTNLKFLMRLSQHPQFVEGRVHTGFIEEHTEMLLGEQAVPQSAIVQAVVGIVLHDESIALNAARTSNDPFNPFATLTGFRVNHLYERKIELWHRNKEYKADVVYNRDGTYTVRVEGAAAPVEVSAKLTRSGAGLVLVLEMDKQNVLRSGVVMQDPHTIHLFTLDGSYKFSLPVYDNSVEGNNEVSDSLVVSPMPGVVDKVMVKEGDSVRVGDPLFVVIAMKMEHVIKSPKEGIIDRVLFQSGENVSKNVALVQWKD
uniref:Lipoyl-binding domain-containing protein n=2 Tax=Homalodisca liturata TaxID=320908 RepID=A0A1B6IT26_9HEMI